MQHTHCADDAARLPVAATVSFAAVADALQTAVLSVPAGLHTCLAAARWAAVARYVLRYRSVAWLPGARACHMLMKGTAPAQSLKWNRS